MFEVRVALEGVVARLAAKRATAEGLARLRRVAERGSDDANGGREPEDSHFVTADIIGWPVLECLRTIAHSWVQLARTELLSHTMRQLVSLKDDRDVVGEEHGRILAVIAARDRDEAERLVRNHFLEGRDRLVRASSVEADVPALRG